jgi:suppressor for copper-sensitivity B
LILNLMPCVLPVLSLKLLSVVSHGGSAPREIRAGFLASAASILFSFLVLAGAAIALKLTGSAVGWGIQFQQPLFLVFMVVLVTGFAANLWGLFEIPLPRAIADIAAGEHSLEHGRDGSHSTSLGGHFATGALATLLATPCSAPFLGTAVGFALASGPFEILAVFTALGLGLGLPHLLVAVFPALAAR